MKELEKVRLTWMEAKLEMVQFWDDDNKVTFMPPLYKTKGLDHMRLISTNAKCWVVRRL